MTTGLPGAALICLAMLAYGTDRPVRASFVDACDVTVSRPDDDTRSRTREERDETRREGIDALVDRLLRWIGEHTEYEVASTRESPPTVTFVEVGESIECSGEEVVVEEGPHAIYDRSTRRVHIVSPWNALDTVDQSVLLHELVHDVQFDSRHWYCPEATEWEAYRLQDAWLAEHELESGFDWMHVYFLSRCPRDMHP